MMEFIVVGLGGAMGSLVRFQIGRIIAQKSKSKFPFGTYAINLSGAFLLGIVSSLSIQMDHHAYLLLADGFLGAYTTFSTFMYEGLSLFRMDQKRSALLYIASTIIFGVVCYGLGYGVFGWIV